MILAAFFYSVHSHDTHPDLANHIDLYYYRIHSAGMLGVICQSAVDAQIIMQLLKC